MDSTNFQHHEQQHQQQEQQQQHLQDHFPLIINHHHPSSSVISYGGGVSTSLDWNPCILPSTTTSSNTFCNKLYEDNESSSSSLITTISPASLKNNDSGHFGYESSNNYPKIEENMLTSFPSFTSLITSPSNMMENSCSFNGFAAGTTTNTMHNNINARGLMQFPLDHKEHYQSSYSDGTPVNNWITSHGFPSTNILHQLGLVSSPNNSTTSVSSSSPRLGLNMQAMDLLGNNASFGSHVLHEEGISSAGKITPNKATAASNGVAGTKRTAGDCSSDRPKASTSNSTAPSKKSQPKLSCPPLKVRKEKLGDRIAALHQMVSPFGKTDTASVLTEAIGYIQFLQDQIHTLCMPHTKPSRNKHSRPFQMGGGNSEEEGKDEEDPRIDIRRRGLCLVPVSWTSFITPNQMDASSTTFF